MRLALSSVCSYLCAFISNLIKWKWKNEVFARLWKVSYSNKGRERLRLLRLQFHSLRLHQDDKNHYAHVYDSMLLSKAAKINTKIFALVVLSLHHQTPSRTDLSFWANHFEYDKPVFSRWNQSICPRKFSSIVMVRPSPVSLQQPRSRHGAKR